MNRDTSRLFEEFDDAPSDPGRSSPAPDVAVRPARLRWIGLRASAAYYFANARNRVSIALYDRFGFVEIARGPSLGSRSFVGGEGVLFRAELSP